MIARRFKKLFSGGRDSGQGLIVVLFVTLILMALVIAATSVTAAQVVPSRQSVDSAAALAAAEGGVDDFIVDVNTACKTPGSCAWLSASPLKSNAVLHAGRAQFSWKVLNASTYVADGFVRVQSTGTVNPGASSIQNRTMVADIKGSPNLLDYLFYTKYETQSAASVSERFKNRTIPLDSTVTSADLTAKTPLTAGTSVTWDGAGTLATQPGVSICDNYWYDTSASGTVVKGRQSLRTAAGTNDPNNAGVDWGEIGRVGTPAVAVSRADACEVSFSTVSKMNGKVYSEDALLISSSVLGGSGPTFKDLVQTKWSTSSTPAADGSRLFRTFAQLPASAPSLGSKLPQTAPSGPVLPTWNGTSAAAAATCTYTGPTRIRMVGANVVVTSPTTPNNATGPSYCYTSAASTVTVPQIGGRSSVYEATYPYAGKTIYVKNSTTASSVTYAPQDVTTVRNATNSLFLAEGATTVNSSVVSPGTPVAIGTWTPKWSGTTNTQNRFQSDIGKTLPAFQTATQTALAAANTASPLSDILSAAIGTAFNGRNNSEGALLSATGRSYNWALPTSTTAAAVRTTGTATYGASTGASSDPLYSGTATTSPYSDSTVESATTVINRQQMTCSVLNVLGLCVGTWIASPGVAAEQQIQVTATKTTTATGTITTRVSAFPLVADRTGYSTTTGDAYVEGSVSGGLSIAAENNVIVTGDVRQASGSTPSVPATQVPFFTSTDAVVLAAQKNVLLYHPVSCKSVTALAATTASYCPNDVTGLYTGGMSSTTFDAAHPSRQYLNLLATPVKQVDAAIYALNGSLQLMNYNRGVELGTLKVNGGVFQEHHGVTGVEWETLTTNSAVRRQSGYNLEYLHDNSLVGKNFPWVPTSTAYVGLVWTLQGISESVGSAAVAP